MFSIPSWLRSRPSQPHPKAGRYRPRIERLEDRTVPTVLTVTSLADSGPGTLRQEIVLANFFNQGGTIVFAPALAGGTISLTSVGNQAAGPSALGVVSAITIQGSGQTITRGAGNMRLFFVSPTGSLTLQNLTLSNGLAKGGNGANGGGGGAGMGGAVFSQGMLSLTGCTLVGNQAVGGDGGDGGAGGGGGMGGDANGSTGGPPNGGSNGGNGSFGGGGGGSPFTVAGAGGFGGGGGACHSGGSNNMGGAGGFGGGGGGASGTNSSVGAGGFGGGNGGGSPFAVGGGGGGGLGGAVFNDAGTVSLLNCTLTANAAHGGNGDSGFGASAGGSGLGGALFALNGSLSVTFCTLAGNLVTAGSGSGGSPQAQGGALESQQQFAPTSLFDSIFANSSGGPDVVINGGLVSGDHNLIRSGTGVPASLIVSTADPLLGTLQNNGGPTPTLALLAGSPAIDAAGTTGVPAIDQRGFLRPAGPAADLGAFEFGAIPPSANGPASSLTGDVTSLVQATFTPMRKHKGIRRHLRLTNVGAIPIAAPLTVVLGKLPAGVRLLNRTGVTGKGKAMRFFVVLDLSGPLSPGQAAGIDLLFNAAPGRGLRLQRAVAGASTL
jgi:hypothetical protein